MTRVSDVPGFAQAVADGGGLPFLALALLREPEVRTLLREALPQQLAGRPWGVGILGFVPPELRAEQLAVVREVRPPFALIAGGRPDQAAGLEREGIATYLHVPSPGLLDQYLRDGSRRFVLEGRECGGHVGPRSSFVLWEQAIGVVGDAIDRGIAADQVSLVFAGGIHDARSAALVAALAGPLAARGVKVGILVGTAYLFTREAVTTGAIVPRFQDEVVRCEETVLLESGPGHQVRVSRTPFVTRFEEERTRLTAEGRSAEEIREALEGLNVGRLRVATKGIDRSEGAGSPLVAVSDEYQATHGLYMLGQVATLRSQTTTIAELHDELCAGSTDFLDRTRLAGRARRQRRDPAAAVGHRDRRHGRGFPRRGQRLAVLVQYAPGLRRHHRGPAGPLGLAAVLRRRPEGPRQDRLEVGRVLARRRIRPASATGCPPRASPRSSRLNCWRSRWSGRRSPTPVTPSGRFLVNRRRWCSAWAEGRRSSRWAMPFVPTCPCSTPCCRRAESRQSSRARGCCRNGPKTRFPVSC